MIRHVDGSYEVEVGKHWLRYDFPAVPFTKRKRRIYQSWAFTKNKDLYHDPSARLDVKALQRNIDTMHEQGILRRSFDVTKNVDESLVNEAAARIK